MLNKLKALTFLAFCIHAKPNCEFVYQSDTNVNDPLDVKRVFASSHFKVFSIPSSSVFLYANKIFILYPENIQSALFVVRATEGQKIIPSNLSLKAKLCENNAKLSRAESKIRWLKKLDNEYKTLVNELSSRLNSLESNSVIQAMIHISMLNSLLSSLTKILEWQLEMLNDFQKEIKFLEASINTTPASNEFESLAERQYRKTMASILSKYSIQQLEEFKKAVYILKHGERER